MKISQKLSLLFGAALNVASVGTLVVMAYRYIWFSVETIPFERLGAAAVMTFIVFIISLPFLICAASKDNPLSF